MVQIPHRYQRPVYLPLTYTNSLLLRVFCRDTSGDRAFLVLSYRSLLRGLSLQQPCVSTFSTVKRNFKVNKLVFLFTFCRSAYADMLHDTERVCTESIFVLYLRFKLRYRLFLNAKVPIVQFVIQARSNLNQNANWNPLATSINVHISCMVIFEGDPHFL